MVAHNLPPLRSDQKGITALSRAGVWERQDASVSALRTFAEALDIQIDPAKVTATDLVSIPDVWAQTEIFRDDLLLASSDDEVSKARQARASGEWRGLIALLALRDHYRYRLKTDIVDLEHIADPKRAPEAGKFGRAVTAIRPARRLFRSQNWNHVTVLSCDDVPVALLVPSTIVAPTKNYTAAFADKDNGAAGGRPYIPWFEKGLLVDPTALRSGLTERDYAVIRAYADALLKDLAQLNLQAADGGLLLTPLFNNLSSFVAACATKAGAQAGSVQRSSVSLGLRFPPDQPLHGTLNTAFAVDGQNDGSDLIVPVRPDLAMLAGDKFKGIVLVDAANKYDQLSRPAGSIRVWGNLLLDRALAVASALDGATTAAGRKGYLCLDVDDLFTPALVVSNDEFKNHPAGFEKIILPFSPIISLLLAPDELRRRVDIEQTPDSETQVSLTLDLRSIPSGQSHTVRLSRTYVTPSERGAANPAAVGVKRVVVAGLASPANLAVWPNFKTDRWNHYSLYHSGDTGTTFGIRAGVSTMAALRAAASSSSPQEGVRTIREWSRGSLVGQQRLPLSKGVREAAVLVSHSPYEAILCEYAPVTRGAAERFVVGIVLLEEIGRPNPLDGRTVIGIDFGTSNTCLYARFPGRRTIEPIDFMDRLLLPCGARPDRAQSYYTDFLSPIPVQTPFMSLLQSNSERATAPDDIPGWRNHILFIARDLTAALSTAGLTPVDGPPVPVTVFNNLKWSRDPANSQRLRAFLQETLSLSLAEVASRGFDPRNVEWRYSFPLSENFDTESFETQLKGAIRTALPGGLPEPSHLGNATESEAAALYFADKSLVRFAGTTVTLDIGGGTTDISVWADRKLVWRQALELAGRKILVSNLLRLPKLMDGLVSSDKRLAETVAKFKSEDGKGRLFSNFKGPKSAANRDSERSLFLGIEMLLNHPDFKETLTNQWGHMSGTPEGRRVALQAELALWGMIYYVGRQMARLSTKMDIHPGLGVTFAIGGRASLLYKLVFGNSPSLRSRAEQVFTAALGLEPKDKIRIDVVYSEDPKHEAAYGLLASDNADGPISRLDLTHFDDGGGMVGEAFTLDGRDLPANTTINEIKEAKELTIDRAMPEFNQFLKVLGNLQRPDGIGRMMHAGISVSEWRGLLRTVEETVKGWVDPSNHKKGRPIIREPVFLVALRALVDMVNDGDVTLQDA